jgi:hypothetical protein
MRTLILIATVLALSACSSAKTGACLNYDSFNNRYVRCGNYGGVAW